MIPPDWFWKAITILIAAWATWTAWQQHRVARDKLRLDLFDKRLAVFQEVKHAITAAYERNEVDLLRYKQAVASSAFLFGSDVHAYLGEVLEKLIQVKEYSGNVRLSAAMYPDNAPKEILLVKWLKAQPDRSVEVFSPYMSFSKARLS
jgi:hypothetical protein